jgi:hypothetical protein
MARPFAALLTVAYFVAALAPETAAFAATRPHTNSNRAFNAACTMVHGAVSIVGPRSVCALPSKQERSLDLSDTLRDACLKDGGTVQEDNDTETCAGAASPVAPPAAV